jgi:tRNA threonylcarbamoyladenosine biosynthesis protein TsaB
MLVLSFDTASSHGGVGLYRDSSILAELRADTKANYSVQLFELTDRLLTRAGVKLADVDLFAVATGPGSFTGIRVGLAAAQGWARALGRPVRGVSVLEAMVSEADPAGGIALPLLDAHRGEFYLGIFRCNRETASGQPAGDRSGWTQSGNGLALDPAGIAALAGDLDSPAGAPTLIAREDDQFAGNLRRGLPEGLPWITVPSLLVGAMARLGAEAARDGRLQHPDELDACYIRRSDAEMNWRE